MLRDLIKRIKVTAEKKELDQVVESNAYSTESEPESYLQLGKVKPSICREIKPVPSNIPTAYCIQSKSLPLSPPLFTALHGLV